MVQPEIETQQTQEAPTNERMLGWNLGQMTANIANLKENSATKTDIAELREDIATKADIAEVCENMITKEDLAKMEARLMWRLIGAMVGHAAVALAIAYLLFG